MTSSLPGGRRKVLVTTRFFDAQAHDLLESRGCQLVTLPAERGEGDLTEDHLAELLDGAEGWIVGPQASVTRTLLATAPALKVIARRGVGYDRVDVAAAAEFGKVVTIAAGGNTHSVADFTVALMLAVGRRLRESQSLMIGGDWTIQVGTELYGRTVGLVGFGRIAREVARRLSGFDCRILVVTPRPGRDLADAYRIAFVDLSTLLRESDYVSLHAPLNSETRNLIDAEALAAMKPNAILVNTSRGGLVDEAALLAALRDRRIRGAGLDVFLGETDPIHRAVAQQLLELPNFVGAPHAAASTDEALARTNLIAAQGVLAVLDGGWPPPECVVVDGRIATKS